MHHSRGLRELLNKAGKPADQIDQLIAQLKSEPTSATVDAADQALLVYAVKLTKEPADIEIADIEKLKQQGFDDRAIHDAACCIGYFAFVNRIADGLGVQIESAGD